MERDLFPTEAGYVCIVSPFFNFKFLKVPLTPNFSATQTVGSPSIVTLTDSSTGSDVAVTQRRVYLQTSTGAFLVPSGTTTEYVAWDILDTSIDIDCLTKDYGLKIVVQWLNVSNVVLYDKTSYYAFTLYSEAFDYGLSQNLVANPSLSNDNNFMTNKQLVRNFIDNGNNAILYNSDTFLAQTFFDKIDGMIDNSQYLFNTNG